MNKLGSALHCLMDSVSQHWETVPKPPSEVIVSELQHEFGTQSASSLADQSIQDVVGLFDDSWPEYLLCYLSPLGRLYYSGAHILLLMDGVARMNGNEPYIKSVKSDFEFMIKISGLDLAVAVADVEMQKMLSECNQGTRCIFINVLTVIESFANKIGLGQRERLEIAKSMEILLRIA